MPKKSSTPKPKSVTIPINPAQAAHLSMLHRNQQQTQHQLQTAIETLAAGMVEGRAGVEIEAISETNLKLKVHPS